MVCSVLARVCVCQLDGFKTTHSSCFTYTNSVYPLGSFVSARWVLDIFGCRTISRSAPTRCFLLRFIQTPSQHTNCQNYFYLFYFELKVYTRSPAPHGPCYPFPHSVSAIVYCIIITTLF